MKISEVPWAWRVRPDVEAARADGRKAGELGLSRDCNPHESGALHHAWDAGWRVTSGEPGFPRNLRILRDDAGLTQRELARRLGMSQVAVSHYENGLRSPSVPVLLKLRDVLGCSVDDLTRNGVVPLAERPACVL